MAETTTQTSNSENRKPFVSKWSSRYRGVSSSPSQHQALASHDLQLTLLAQATIEDLDPPAALSLNPSDPISMALMSAFERDYTHLTVIDASTRALLGYISIPQLQEKVDAGKAKPDDPISTVMARFRRGGKGSNPYRMITMATPLEELEEFFEGGATGGSRQDFAVVTDERRRFVLGVATVADLEEFVKRRPA